MFGSATTSNATRVLLLGSGELGKEVAIECQRLGLEVIACDRYPNAPAMQVAHRSHVLNMLDEMQLRKVVELENPHYIVPEIEAIATDVLVELEQQGLNVVPSAKAVKLTMDREGIRKLAAEQLGLQTSPYQFADNYQDFLLAIEHVGLPCVCKPVMSSSGKGQSVIRKAEQVKRAWDYSQQGGRGEAGRVIVEGFIDFDYEITLLTARSINGVHFCDPIGHRQEDGDYRESWQPQSMSQTALIKAQHAAKEVVNALGGYGIFGVELFIKGDEVIFNEVSPRPHDTGLVTLISQDMSEFALHVRAFTGLPVGTINQLGNSASAVILGQGKSNNIRYHALDKVLENPTCQLRLFGKPDIDGQRRLGVVLAKESSIELAIESAVKAASHIEIEY
ncbi:formate-dependent phosphoribosylglycinamide formyltransferase [Vibrio marisflavi]|uniref:Formate-dependent phosphoribosylglycinamide formyltransferase n=1 Tax=Vibrio marisflavi CECT 7928 TaxID=634439 RepID=A0ABN8E6N0_9VIBR|nr:formate-dependent phosphoribosylglycinamide formyltransferase [Vibrio marisflavi]CAH0540125.1 Formate-dependent phosphoribosylglycinamide formyltransferase [Vibrio marisflavi CECT 7928]